jgi:hypothetical protein
MKRRKVEVCTLGKLTVVFSATDHGDCLFAAKVEERGSTREAGESGGHEGKADSGSSKHVVRCVGFPIEKRRFVDVVQAVTGTRFGEKGEQVNTAGVMERKSVS